MFYWDHTLLFKVYIYAIQSLIGPVRIQLSKSMYKYIEKKVVIITQLEKLQMPNYLFN